MNAHEREHWPTVVAHAHAEAGAAGWRAAVLAQRTATPAHSDVYALAGHVVDTLRALDALAGALARQVAGYADGRELYDDEGTDPRTRLRSAVLHLAVLRQHAGEAERAANEFWSAISHIGERVQP